MDQDDSGAHWLKSAGEVADLIRAADWAATPFGPLECWPSPLRATLSLMLECKFPMVLLWGGDLRLLYNDAYRSIAANRHPASLGRPRHETWPEITHILAPIFAAVMERGESLVFEDKCFPVERRGYREDAFFTLSYSPVRLADGSVGGTLVVVYETTERRKLEQRLIASEHRLRDAQRIAGLGYWEWDLVSGQTLWSPEIYAMHGEDTDAPGFTPEALLERVHPDDVETVRGVIGRAIAEAAAVDLEYRVFRPDGSFRWIHARGAVTGFDADGRPRLMLGTNQDITERKAVEAELAAHRQRLEALVDTRTAELSVAKEAAEAANSAKSAFLAAASHDLRQPMQAIGLFVDALEQTPLSGEQQRIVRQLGESSRSLSDLLNALLDISKLDAGAVSPTPEVIPAGRLLRRIESDFLALAARKSLRLRLCCPAGDIALHTDAKLLMSLLGNLVGNAIKYTARGGVLVALRRRGAQALIQVWDSGCGIAPEHQGRIFEAYFQIGNPERDRTKGLGLGLAIATRIAALLGSEIDCRSRPGRGSVFSFRLPLATGDEDADAGGSGADAGAVAAAAMRHVVLVEDDMMVGAATELALEASGMRVTRYASAEDALADPVLVAADFYITDLRLPGVNGVEFLDLVRQRRPQPVKAAVITGDAAANRSETIRACRWPVLLKPVGLASLLAAIAAQDATN